MAGRLQGKTAFCTASGAGIGRATAMAFAREGARVIATDISEDRMKGLKEAGIAECLKLDVLDTAAVQGIAKQVGSVDVLFNCAGFVHHGDALHCTDKDWDFSFDLNVKAMHRGIQAFLPGMVAKGKGAIVCPSHQRYRHDTGRVHQNNRCGHRFSQPGDQLVHRPSGQIIRDNDCRACSQLFQMESPAPGAFEMQRTTNPSSRKLVSWSMRSEQ